MSSTDSTARLSLPDAAVFAAASLLFWVLYSATKQALLFGDGPQLVSEFSSAEPGEARWMHVSYFRWADLLRMGTGEALAALHLVSSLFSALAVGAAYLLCRACGGARGPAMFAAALLGTAPSYWLFATTVEVYPPHTFLVVVGAWGLVFASRLGNVAKGIGMALLLFGLQLSHLGSPLLCLGWIGLWLAGEGSSGRLRAGRAIGIAALLGGMQLAVIAITSTLFEPQGAESSGQVLDFLERHQAALRVGPLLGEWIAALALLVPLAVLGLVSTEHPPRTRLALVAFLLPPLAFVLWLGISEHGGYFLASAPFYAVLAARPRGALRSPWLLAALLAAQVFLGYRAIAPSSETQEVSGVSDLRAQVVSEYFGEEGLLVSFQFDLQPIGARLPGIEEVNLGPMVGNFARRGDPPGAFAEHVLPGILLSVESGAAKVGLDLGYRRIADEIRVLMPFLEQLERALRERTTVEVTGSDDWPIWILTAAESER